MKWLAALLALLCTAAVPTEAWRWQRTLVREAQATWGPAAPVAALAAQLEQESGWRSDANSPVGAQGLAQFMPETATWLALIYPELRPADPYDPRWAIRAQVAYMYHLYRRTMPHTDGGFVGCSQYAFTLRAYNGGQGNVLKDRRKATTLGLNADDWVAVGPVRGARRSDANHRENKRYPERVLLVLMPRYAAVAYGEGVTCE